MSNEQGHRTGVGKNELQEGLPTSTVLQTCQAQGLVHDHGKGGHIGRSQPLTINLHLIPINDTYLEHNTNANIGTACLLLGAELSKQETHHNSGLA